MKTRLQLVIPAIVVSAILVQPGSVQSQGRGQQAKGQPAAKASHSDGISFGPVEIRIIREWFGSDSNRRGLPPGLAKKETLPPGLQKQLRKNGTLPPGLAKKIHPLPVDLERRLPRLPDGRDRIIISGTVILRDKNLGKILDILEAVF